MNVLYFCLLVLHIFTVSANYSFNEYEFQEFVNVPPKPISLTGMNTSFAELDQQFARYNSDAASYMAHQDPVVATSNFADKLPSSVRIIDRDMIDYNQIVQYQLEKRELLTSSHMQQIVTYNPKATIFFEDTKTVLMPDKATLASTRQDLKKRLKKGDIFLFVEVDISHVEFKYEDVWFPASPCLEFDKGDNSSTGSLKMNYCSVAEIDINIGLEDKGEVHIGNLTLAFSTGSSLTIGRSMKFCGQHSCSTVNGTTIRMLYRPHTVTVTPKTRKLSFNTSAISLEEQLEWEVGQTVKYFTDAWSLFSCASEKYVDLRCYDPGLQYKDEMGNTFRSIVDSSRLNDDFDY